MRTSTVIGAALGACLFASLPASAEIPLSTTRVASGLSLPVFVTAPPGDTGRLFIVEQGSGTSAVIKILDLSTNTVLATPFLTLSGVDHTGSNERGLFSLAFHPDYATNGYFYVHLSDSSSSNMLRRYTVSANPNVADPGSMQPVLTMSDPFANHNGGWIAFGPDGDLYVSTGDGGSFNDPFGNAQNTTVLLGKMLRLDVDGDDFPADPARNYAIPAGNPFAGAGDPGADEIWFYGLRNPWRASFDSATGEIYIGDVGQDAWEEVSVAPAGLGGLNFGWRCMEGNSCTGLSGCTCNSPSLTDPIQVYSLAGSPCAVTGGYVYRGSALCGLQGTYFYADYCSNAIWSFRYSGGFVTNFTNRTSQLDPPGTQSILSISSFGEDQSGEMYICDRNGGELFKIIEGTLVDCNANLVQDACDIESGTSLDVDSNGIPDECQPEVTAFCFGDGSAGACPCGNTGSPGRGCQNSAGTGGASLSSSGAPSVTSDTFVMVAAGEMPSALTIFLQGDVESAAVPFGDGLRCAAGSLKRLYTKNASGGTVSAPTGAELPVSERSDALGDPLSSGDTRLYHTYYRDPSQTFCPVPTGSTFNSSGGLRVRWGT